MTRVSYGLSLGLLLGALAGLAWWLTRPAGSGPEVGDPSAESAGESAAPSLSELAAPQGRPGRTAARGARLPRGEGSIVGTVRRDGVPVAARVSIHVTHVGTGYVPWGRGVASWYERAFALPPSPESASGSVRAGEDGRFTIEGMGAGAFLLVADTEDGATGSVTAVVPAEGARVEVSVAVTGGPETLRGRVVWADGRPFAGTVVVGPAGDPRGGRDPVPQGLLVPVDADGRFVASGLPTGTVAVTATAETRFVLRGPAVTLPYAGEYLLTVDAGLAKATGRVVRDEDGTPVAGADVLGGGSGPSQGMVFARTTTDADGRFEVLLPQGRDTGLFVRAEGYAPYVRPRTAAMSAEPLEIRLTRGASVAGRVTRDADGAPVAGMTVAVVPLGSRDGWVGTDPVTTDADGRYALAGLAPGEAMVVAEGQGYVTKGIEQVTPQGYNPLAFTLKASEVATADVLVTAGARIEGVVLDAGGVPVAGAVVRMNSRGGMGRLPSFGTGTGAPPVATGRDGRFVFEGAVPGLPHTLSADAPGFSTASAGPVVPVLGAAETVEIRFAAARFVEVTVLDDAAGSPVPSARILPQSFGWGPYGGVTTYATAADGRARVGPMPPGQQSIAVEAAGYARATVAVGEADATLVARLKPGFDVAGRVTWADGSPAPAARVSAGASAERRDLTTAAGPDGAFLLRGVPAGSVSLRADAMKDVVPHRASATVEAGARDVVLKLGPEEGFAAGGARKIVARVLDADGRPVPRAMARLRTRNGTSGTNVTDGRVEWNQTVPAGSEAFVEVYGARGADGALLPLGPAQVRLPEGASEVEVRLPPEVFVAGTVRTADGAPVRGVVVRAQPVGKGPDDGNRWWGDVPQARTDEAGAFRLGGLGATDFDLAFVVPPTYAPVKPLRVRGGDTTVDVRLRAGLTAAVTVLDPDGVPVSGVSVRARAKAPQEVRYVDPRGGDGSVVTDARGVARVGGLDAEVAYALEVGGKGEDLGNVTLDPWTPRDETVRLRRVFVVAGIVQDRAGRPVPNAHVMRKEGSGWSGTGTGPDGRFRMGGLPSGDVVLRATLPQGQPVDPNDATGDVRVAAGTKDVVLTLDTGQEIVVRIENPGDWASPYLGAQLVVRRDGQTLQFHAYGEASAPLRFQGLRPGDECTFWLPPANPQSDACAYVPGLRPGAEVRVRLVAGGTIRGRLKAPAGAREFGVGANRDGLGLGGQAKPDGTFEIRGVPPGTTWSLDGYAQSADGATWFMGKATAASGETVEIELKPPESAPKGR